MTTSRSRPDTTPRIPEIAAALRSRIDAGEFGTDGKLPSTRQLVDQYEISAQAIARVVALLKAEGVVVGRQGAGVFVRSVDPLQWDLTQFERGARRDDVAAGLDDWQASVVAQGRTPEQRLIGVTQAPGQAPSRDVARWLELDADELVIVRRRLRLVDGVPTQIADSWFRASFALGTPLMEERDVTMPGGILAAIGHPQVRTRDEITPRMPTAEETTLLELPLGTAVGQHVRIGFGADGLPFRAMVTIAPGDRNVMIYEMEV
ncbi:GntR family transcriptional regulator [Kitasatospora sp. NPDC101155]|uniref:GntR family transcriptional regulator n=1 Tax=Kitasatospora sp. NPDC101155 TaxID=3364097 RepID=UPI0037F5D112